MAQGGMEEIVPRLWCILSALKTESAILQPMNLPGVLLAETGIGPQNALRAIRKLVDEKPIGGIIHIGFAGALTTKLHLGDIVLLSSAESIDGVQSVALGSEDKIAKAFSVESRWTSGVCITCDRIIAVANDKRALAELRPEGEITCVDMESAPVAEYCQKQNLPYIGIRAITDALDEDLPLDLNECRGRDGNIDTMRVMWAAVHHPSSIAGLMELRRRAHNCADTLAKCVANVVAAYPTPADFTNAHPR
jgi:adenosylhomocysteine nucleosidase